MKKSAFIILLFAFTHALYATPVGWWRNEEVGATDGGTISAAVSSANTGTLDGTASGAPLYSSDVPGAVIFDPVSGTSVANNFSMNNTPGNSRVNVNNHALLNAPTSFTFEYFMRLDGEPTAYHGFVQRLDTTHTVSSNDVTLRDNRRWQIDFDHGASGGQYGNIRVRFDTHDPALEGPTVGDGQTDFNAVARGGHIFVDTDTGSNNPADYTNADAFAEGDGMNDALDWHHVAITLDGATDRVNIFLDYVQIAGSTKALAGDFVHPDGQLRFGKLNAAGYGLQLDEVRYSDTVLLPSEFLVAIPEPSAANLLLLGSMLVFSLRRIKR